MKIIFIFSFALFFLTGCATKYQPMDATGGYKETQLVYNIFRVTFSGNGGVSKEKASDYALLRLAEVALMNGYNYFIIVDSDKYSSKDYFKTPTSYTKNYGTNRVTSSGGETFEYSKPTTSNTIVCYKERPDNDVIVYDAKFLVNSLKSKYEINY